MSKRRFLDRTVYVHVNLHVYVYVCLCVCVRSMKWKAREEIKRKRVVVVYLISSDVRLKNRKKIKVINEMWLVNHFDLNSSDKKRWWLMEQQRWLQSISIYKFWFSFFFK